MKKLSILTILLVVGFVGCISLKSGKKDKSSPKQMTLTTDKEGEVVIIMEGTGIAIKDWGDGTPSEKVTLSKNKAQQSTITPGGCLVFSSGTVLFSKKQFSPTCTRGFSRIITITGTNITDLSCSFNQITALDVSENTALKSLICSYNQLTALNVRNNTALQHLQCHGNQLTTLDISKNMALINLLCEQNQLTNLNVSNNTALESLNCGNNQLTTLDLSNNTTLTFIDIQNNLFDDVALNNLFKMLHKNIIGRRSKGIIIRNNPGAETCEPNIANSKDWTVVR